MHPIHSEQIEELAEYVSGGMAPDEQCAFELALQQDPTLSAFLAYIRKPEHVDSEVLTALSKDWEAPLEAISQRLKVVIRDQANDGNESAFFPAKSHSSAISNSSWIRRSWRSTQNIFVPARNRYSAVIGTLCFALLTWYGVIKIGANGHSDRSFVYMTAPGEQATVRLPDGSVAKLNVGTRLEVPADYDRGNRTVRLEGEALFTTEHKAGSPFSVLAGPSTTRVLGTTFSVRYYATDTVASVAVRDGKVSVRSTILTAGERVFVAMNDIRPVSTALNGDAIFNYSRLSLNDVALSSAIVDLNRWYGADIRIGDNALNDKRIFGVFPMGSITDLATILEWTFHMRVVREGSVLTLYSKE